MRKLAWFAGGFAGACLVGCYAPGLLLPALAVLAGLTLVALLLRLVGRKRPALPVSPAAIVRRVLALGLGGVAAAG